MREEWTNCRICPLFPLAFPAITGYNGLRLQKVRCRNEFYFSQIIQINERMCG